MTEGSLTPADSPYELLAAVRAATRQVRVAQRGTWFPLLVLAAINIAAIPVYRFGPRHLSSCRQGPGGTSVCAGFIPAVLVYWPLALVLAYVAIASFYVHRSRRQGVGTLIRPYVVVGVALAFVLTAASLWRALHPRVPSIGTAHLPAPSPYDLATPAAAIGLALLVLAWVERNPALFAFSFGYLVIVLVNSARVIHSRSQWWFLPQLLIPAALLLAGSACFALLQRSTEARSR